MSARTFSATTDEWIILSTEEGHLLVLTSEIIQVVDLRVEGGNAAQVTVRNEDGWTRNFVVTLTTEAIAQLLREGFE
jgi:hypothetical protein